MLLILILLLALAVVLGGWLVWHPLLWFLFALAALAWVLHDRPLR